MESKDVKAFRKNKKMTQDELARRIGVDQSRVSRIEAGGYISGPIKMLLRQLMEEEA